MMQAKHDERPKEAFKAVHKVLTKDQVKKLHGENGAHRYLSFTLT